MDERKRNTMGNIFQEKDSGARKHSIFTWEGLGNIKEGRGNLGEDMPVVVYRLLEFTMLHTLADEFGEERANELFQRAGFMAGEQLARNTLDLDVDFNEFVEQLQKIMRELKIAVMRIESFNDETGELFLTAAEDLDCSGLPTTGEMVCKYDEGFISGLLYAYTGKKYDVKEVDCWANGDRVCRFHGQLQATPAEEPAGMERQPEPAPEAQAAATAAQPTAPKPARKRPRRMIK